MSENSRTCESMFKYEAFISYAHEDEGFAKKLQKRVEAFRLPRKMRKLHRDFPKKIYPIFRDKTDLLPKKLDEEIIKNLASSKYLIVICSPHSSKASYVDFEVQSFMKYRSTKNIIPVIINGEVGSKDENTECFCPALLHEESITLGVDYQKMKSSDAFIKIIAVLTDKYTTDFIDRWTRYQKRKRVIRNTILSVLLICAGIAGYLSWDYYVPKTNYYADYITQWGVPIGIAELTEEQIARIYAHYEITTCKGHVQMLVYANSAGGTANYVNDLWADRPQAANYYYRDDGKIDYIEYLNSAGAVECSMVCSTDLRYVDFQVDKDNSNADTLISQLAGTGAKRFDPTAGSVIDINSDITRYCVTYNAKGQLTQVLFQRDNRGTAATDTYGISGIRYDLDTYGRVVARWFMDRNGESMYDAVGIAGQVFVYSGVGMPVQVINKGIDDCNKNSTQGWAIKTRTFDSFGNVIFTQYSDLYEKPAYYVSGHTAFSGLAKTYNSEGFISSESNYDADGDLMCCSDGYAIKTYKYNENGTRSEIKYYDQNNSPVLNTSGYHMVRLTGSEEGLSNCMSYYDTSNQPVNLPGGYGQYVETYDASGNILTKEYYDKDGLPVISREGMHKRVFTYDKVGQIASISVYGMQDEPIVITDTLWGGTHKMCLQYDDNGNIVCEKFYGVEEEPIEITDGYFELRCTFSNSGNLLEESYWGIDGTPLISKGTGCHRKTYQYDNFGNTTEITVFAADDSPTVLPDSKVWKIVNTYDENNNQLSGCNYGIDGNPVYTPRYGRWFRIDSVCDDKGNSIEEIYYDLDGSLGYCLDGYAIARYEYNEEGTEVKKASYFDIDSKPVLCTDGYASATFEHDIYGNITKESFFGTDGNLVISNNDFAIGVMEHDYMGRLLSMAFYDTDEEPMLFDNSHFRITFDYLSNGNKEIRTYLTKAAYETGRYGTYCLYNSLDKLVEEKFIDSKGEYVSD